MTGGPDLHPELTAQLEVIATDPEAAESTGLFRIDGLGKANWAVSRIAEHRARLGEAVEYHRAEKTRLDAWMDERLAECERRCSFLEGELRRYHEGRLEANKRDKTVKLPAGELHARKQPDAWEIDGDLFIPWALTKGNERDVVRITEAVDRAAVKKAFHTISAGADEPMRVVTDDGEIVPGVQVFEGDVAYTVHPHREPGQ